MNNELFALKLFGFIPTNSVPGRVQRVYTDFSVEMMGAYLFP